MNRTRSLPTILVVDDDPGMLILIEAALRAEQWNVATAASGADALAWLHKNSADLLLLDLKLSDIEGRELIAKLAEAGRSVPFIVITGQGDERVAVDMMKRGALDYLGKDVNFVEFVPTVVRHSLARIEQQKQLVAAQTAARESDERYRTLVEMSPDAIFVLKHGRIELVNLEGVHLLGAESAGQVVGKSPLDFFHQSRHDVIRQRIDFVSQCGVASPLIDEELVRLDGSTRWVTLSSAMFTEKGQSAVQFILRDITECKRLEKEIIEISERERRSFGQDLHDGLGQRLTGLEMLSHALAVDLKCHALAPAKQAQRLNRELRKTVTDARLISHALAPVSMEGEGLMHGLKTLAASTSRIPKVACRFTCNPPVCIQDVTTATHLYRIAQEAVNNALKHGRAKAIDITLAEGSKGVELAIENNGRVFPKANGGQRGMGLSVMRYRADMIGATLSIESGGRKGVQVICNLRRKT